MSELTTSRVNRQFRTLRSKCAALASLAHAPSRPAVSVTYGSSSRTIARKPLDDGDAPPLAILQSLDKLGSRLHFDRAIVESMQLSKRIYEVRDAFKNIVQSSLASQKGQTADSHTIMPLTGICARLIGECIQSEMDASSRDPRSDGEDREDDMRTSIMDDLYEQVPNSYRRYTLVAHCLTYILETCPHHPTLLNALLEVCLFHCLATEARAVLAALFTVSILPRPSSPSCCPLTHPAHKNFLTSLRELCTGSDPSVPYDHATPAMNDRTFTGILVDALSLPYPEQIPAWTSKPITRLARELRQKDFAGCFVPLVCGLANCLAQESGIAKKTGPQSSTISGGMQTNLHDDGLDRLAKWVVSMLDVLYMVPTASSGEELRACVDFLVEVEKLGFHMVDARPPSPPGCVAEALCCLAAYCLSSPLTLQLPGAGFDLPVLERLLRSAHVKNQTFDGLISHIFPLPNVAVFRMPLSEVGDDTCTPPPSQPTVNGGGAGAIEALALPLRTRRLLQCEVALYRGTLEHVEALISAPSHTLPPTFPLSQKDLADLRLQFLDRAEDAERRCYGSASDPSQPPSGGEWVWEEMVGSWVMRSPAPAQAKKMKEKELERLTKRRRTEGGLSVVASSSRASQREVVAIRSNRASSSESRSPTSSMSSISMKRSATRSRMAKHISFAVADKENSSDSDGLDGDNYQDLGTDPLISGEADCTPAPKRKRNFATILADAHVNAISLRAERAAAKLKPKPRTSAPPRIFAVPESPASASPFPRRSSNFATLLADSHRNAISLREERARERARGEALQNSSRSSIYEASLKRKRRQYAYGRSSPDFDDDIPSAGTREDALSLEPESSPVRGSALVEPSSDDVLNLFAYPDSSPVATRRYVR